MAAGGGGDAVGALLARRALGDADDRPPLVTTCAWERLRIDPVPGPRARTDFTGLGLVGGEPCEVRPDSDTVPSGRSVLPRLAETGGARIFLHDFEGGAVGLGVQLQQLATSLDADNLVVVDVGGDMVARGQEPELLSPLADSLTLAGALEAGIPTSAVVLGPGADAELPEGEVLGHLGGINANVAGRITTDDVRDLGAVLSWHPTEASALVAAAAMGLRGAVAMRRGRAPVPITPRTAEVWRISHPNWQRFPLARALQETDSLAAAERVMRAVAVNEIDFERRILSDRASQRPSATVSQLIADMQAVGATHVTNRRMSQTLGGQDLSATEASLGSRSVRLWSLNDLAQTVQSPLKSQPHSKTVD